jgi:phosphotransferase system IIB component
MTECGSSYQVVSGNAYVNNVEQELKNLIDNKCNQKVNKIVEDRGLGR